MKTIQEATTQYVRKSLMTFLEGGKYTRNRKPLSFNWIMGVIRNSGIEREELCSVLDRVGRYQQNSEGAKRVEDVWSQCSKEGLI